MIAHRSWMALAGLLLFASGVPAAQLCFGPTSGGSMANSHCVPVGPTYSEGWQGFATTAAEACLAGDACGPIDGPTVFSISRSATDPYLNEASLPEGTSTLYLWLNCCQFGLSEATFSLSGDIDIVSFTTTNGFTNSGPLPDFHIAVTGCPLGPMVVGLLEVQLSGPTAVGDWGVSSWGRVKALYGGDAR